MTQSLRDADMMAIALRMAKRGLGQVAPNPAVGAVIANDTTGEVIARGWTQPGGRPHAETEALSRAGALARGATIYVTLEPCSHHGQTGPCADAIVKAGIKRAVVAIEDPDGRVAGRGLRRLRDAGVEVVTGVLAEQARWLTLGHILRVTERRPFVQAKLAVSGDGDVPRGDDGQPTWVTGPLARAYGAMLRAEADAILVGGGTVADDDPQLTCRLPGLAGRSPNRVILSASLNLPLGSQLFATAREVPLWVITSSKAPYEKAEAIAATGAEVLPVVMDHEGTLDLQAVLAVLADRGVTRLLVEGGPRVWRGFSDAGLVDEAFVFQGQSPKLDTRAAAVPFINLDGFTLSAELNLANDALGVFRAKR